MKTILLTFFSLLIINTVTAQITGSLSTSLASQTLLLADDKINISGSTTNNKNIIEWTFAENESSNYFEVQKSEDGVHFSTAGLVFSTVKEGNEMYAFKENKTNSNYYRLMIINKDKSYKFSKVISLKDQSYNSSNIKISHDLSAGYLVLSYTTEEKFSGIINIYNVTGVKIFSKETAFAKGLNTMDINIDNNLVAGTYFIEVTNKKQRSFTKFINK